MHGGVAGRGLDLCIQALVAPEPNKYTVIQCIINYYYLIKSISCDVTLRSAVVAGIPFALTAAATTQHHRWAASWHTASGPTEPGRKNNFIGNKMLKQTS